MTERRTPDEGMESVATTNDLPALFAGDAVFFRTVIDRIAEGVLAIDETDTIVFANQALERLIGYSPAEIVGEPAETVIPGRDRHERHESATHLEACDADSTQLLRHAAGYDVTVETTTREFEDADGRIVAILLHDGVDRTQRTAELKDRIHQQAITAAIGQSALATPDLDRLMDEAAKTVADVLNAEYCKILDLVPGSDKLVLRHGVGWRDGLVGNTTVPTDRNSQAGYTLLSEEPVVVTDLQRETRFSGPDLLTNHDVRSGISVVIGSVDQPWGILGVHTTTPHEHAEHDVNFVQNVANVLAQALERKQRERELRREKDRFERVVESIDEYAIFTLDPDGAVASWNDSADRLTGYRADDVLGEHVSLFYCDDDRADGAPEDDLAVAAHERTADAEGWRVRADGTTFWTDYAVSAIRDDDGELLGFTTVIRDMTERRERERTLQRERELLETSPVGIIIVDANGEIVRANAHAGALYDREPATLRGCSYEAVEWGLVTEQGTPLPESAHPVSRVFATGEPVTGTILRIDRAGRTRRWVSVSAAPIHGPNDTITRVVTATEDITEQKERERQLRHQRDSLERIRQVTDSLQSTNRALVRAGTREELEQEVCDRLAATESYTSAWIGDTAVESGRVTPRAWAGVEEEYLLEITADDSVAGQRPTGRAVRTQSVQTARNILEDPAYESWRARAIERGYRSSAAVPVVYGGTLYCVLNLYSSRPFAFDTYEQALLADLGTRIGHAIGAIKARQRVHTDAVVELEFKNTASRDVLVSLSEEFDCRLEINKFVPTSGGTFVCYATVDGTDPDRVRDRLAQVAAIDQARVTRATNEGGVLEFVFSGASPSTHLANHGATITEAVVERGTETLVGEVAPDVDIRALIERLRTAFPEIELVSKRRIDRPDDQTPEDVLTERQREVLEIAFHAGFFATPRDSTGEEVAEALDIASPTFYQHIRTATRKVIAGTIIDDRE